MLPGITELSVTMQRRPGGHNFPDMEVVIDTAQTDIEDGAIFLVQIKDRAPVVKKCVIRGNEVILHPALAAIDNPRTITLFGREIPCHDIEFSDNVYKQFITVHGRVVGLWAGVAA